MTYLHRRGSRLTDGDAVAHLQYVHRLFETEGSSVSLRHRYLLDSEDYPTGFHRLLYHCGVRPEWLELYGGFLPTLADLALLSLIGLAVSLWGGEHTIWLLAFPFQRLWIANIGRASHFSERAYGIFWGNLYLFAMAGIVLQGGFWWWLLALVAFTIVGVSSKFGWQGSLFTPLVLSIITLDPIYLLITIGCALGSTVISLGTSWRVLSGLIRHSRWYCSYLIPRYQAVRSHYAEIWSYLKRPRLKEGILLFLRASPLKIISDNPMHLLLPLGWQGDLFSFWVLSGVLLCLLISTATLKFLGEPERYLEFTALPLFVLASHQPLWWPVPALLLVVYALHWYLFLREGARSKEKEEELLALNEAMAKIKESTFLTIPMRSSFFLGLHHPTNRFVTLFANVGKGEIQERYNALMPDRYPFPGPDLADYVKEYEVDYLLVDRTSLGELPDDYYDFSLFSPFKEVGRYTLLKSS